MLTQDDYKLLTGQTVNCSDEDWDILVDIAKLRLASFLCLDEFPELDETNNDLALLLANFLCSSLKFQGAPDTIESKSVRNFTINFKSSATNAFEQIYKQYEDIIEKYNKCHLGIKVECSARHCCGFYNGFLNF
mgnify:CR=1 FL=1